LEFPTQYQKTNCMQLDLRIPWVVLLRLSEVHPLLPLTLVVAVLLLCLHFLVKLCSAKTMKKLSASSVHPIQTTQLSPLAPSLVEEGSSDAASRMEEGLRDAINDGHDDVEAAVRDIEGEDEAEDGLEFELDEEEAEDSSDQSLRLEMFVGDSALGSSASDSSSGQFWNQMSSLWSSKSDSSEDLRPLDSPLSTRSGESVSQEATNSYGERAIEGEDEAEDGLELDLGEVEAEDSSDESLRLEMFRPASASGSSSSSGSSSDHFWLQMFSLWGSKSESSDESHPLDSPRSNSDEESDSSSSSESDDAHPSMGDRRLDHGERV
jgi:hypothetical protein